MMAYALIDFGAGQAQLWGDFSKETVEDTFHDLADQCFGIRKSISFFGLREFNAGCISLPHPWSSMEGSFTVLKHSGDVIVWDESGEKIKSEWD